MIYLIGYFPSWEYNEPISSHLSFDFTPVPSDGRIVTTGGAELISHPISHISHSFQIINGKKSSVSLKWTSRMEFYSTDLNSSRT